MPLVSTVPEDILDLIVVLRRYCSLCKGDSLRVVKLLEVLHVVDIVGNLHSSARHADLVPGISCLLLLLRACAIV